MSIQFPYPGGKAKIREQLFPYFPEEGRQFIEPFVGRGNIFFEFYKRAQFDSWHLNDLKLATFFTSLRNADLNDLPSEIDEFNFEVWQNRWLASNPIAHIIEPKITFRGKGYPSGYQHGRYNKGRYRLLCQEAKAILQDPKIKITRQDWAHLPYNDLNESDFVYLDPPYYNTKGVGYNNIDHVELLTLLTNAPFRWALSGYESDLYLTWLGEPTFKLERGHEMSDDRGATTMECLWTNG